MQGPFVIGTLVSPVPPSAFEWETGILIRGTTYLVVKPFVDGDGDRHAFGEEWQFIATMFNRQYSEVDVCVRLPSAEEWIIPMFWALDRQGEILENFRQYVAPVPAETDAR